MATSNKKSLPAKAETKREPAPVLIPFFGAMDEGKTWRLERMLNTMKHRTIVVYNFGKPNDWKGFLMIELLILDKELHFQYKGQQLHFEQHFMRVFRNKRVKILATFDPKTTKLFYQALSNINNDISQLCLIFEDATNLFNSNLPAGVKGILSRCKHKDNWFYTLSHDMHYFPPQIYTLATHIVIFRTVAPPPIEKRMRISPAVFDLAAEAWEWLNEKHTSGSKENEYIVPKFHYAIVDTRKHELKKFDASNKHIGTLTITQLNRREACSQKKT